MNRTESPSAHLERSLKINDLIEVAVRRLETINASPYYDVFGTHGERMRDTIRMRLIILRLQTWFYQCIQRAHECQI